MGNEINSDISESHFATVEGDMNNTGLVILAGGGNVDVADVSEGVSGAGELGLIKSHEVGRELGDSWLECSVDPGKDIFGLVIITVVDVGASEFIAFISEVVGDPGVLGGDIVDGFQVGSVVFVPITSLLSNSWLDDTVFSTIIDIDFLALDIAQIINFSLETLGLSVESIEVDGERGDHTG